jgi:cytochrome c-type biogenesis protein CcmH
MMKLWLLALSLIISSQCFAIDDHQLTDPKQQKAYELIISELRCLVCQNQTIADSNAELAADLRRQTFEMLQQGKSKDEIVQFMTDRYGDFVLYGCFSSNRFSHGRLVYPPKKTSSYHCN